MTQSSTTLQKFSSFLREMSALVVPQSAFSTSDANRAILTSIILSVLVTLILWGVQSIFHLNWFWTFVIYIGLLFLLFYLILPKISGGTKTGVVISGQQQ